MYVCVYIYIYMYIYIYTVNGSFHGKFIYKWAMFHGYVN